MKPLDDLTAFMLARKSFRSPKLVIPSMDGRTKLGEIQTEELSAEMAATMVTFWPDHRVVKPAPARWKQMVAKGDVLNIRLERVDSKVKLNPWIEFVCDYEEPEKEMKSALAATRRLGEEKMLRTLAPFDRARKMMDDVKRVKELEERKGAQSEAERQIKIGFEDPLSSPLALAKLLAEHPKASEFEVRVDRLPRRLGSPDYKPYQRASVITLLKKPGAFVTSIIHTDERLDDEGVKWFTHDVELSFAGNEKLKNQIHFWAPSVEVALAESPKPAPATKASAKKPSRSKGAADKPKALASKVKAPKKAKKS